MATQESQRRGEAQLALERSIDEYLGFLGGVRHLSENTLRAYRIDLTAFLDWSRREGVSPLELTHRDVRSYLLELTRAGYTTRTIGRRLSALRGLYRWMQREGRCSSGVVTALSSPKLARSLPRTMTDNDARALLETCSGDDPVSLRDRAFLELLYATGADVVAAAVPEIRDGLAQQGAGQVVQGLVRRQQGIQTGVHGRQGTEKVVHASSLAPRAEAGCSRRWG